MSSSSICNLCQVIDVIAEKGPLAGLFFSINKLEQRASGCPVKDPY
jgi:hypothetical protein